MFYHMFAYHLLKMCASIALTTHDANEPAVDDASDSVYFDITMTLTAPVSGMLGTADALAPRHKTDPEPSSPLAGEDVVTRFDNLYSVAKTILMVVVRTSVTF